MALRKACYVRMVIMLLHGAEVKLQASLFMPLPCYKVLHTRTISLLSSNEFTSRSPSVSHKASWTGLGNMTNNLFSFLHAHNKMVLVVPVMKSFSCYSNNSCGY